MARLLIVLAALLTLAPARPAPAQDQPERMHPGVALGRRASLALASRRVVPTIVLTPDPVSYAEAIGAWTPEEIFPVLLDDGSPAMREHIGRFSRAFRPEAVVRWEAPDDAPRAGGPMRPRRAVPNARALAERALARAWGADDRSALPERWRALGRTPPGVALADERDPAWTAALALAAGHGQPLLWLEMPSLTLNGALDVPQAEALCAEIEQAVEALGHPWRGLGDDLDALALCASLPGRIETAPGEFSATTDRMGRHAGGDRWAWAGQVCGSEAEAAYLAMCSLFLTPDRAWVFDGYAEGAPWNRWHGAPAAEALRRAGIETDLDDRPDNTAEHWRRRAERPVKAGLILLNSSGNRGWFDLGGSRAQSGDVPLLEVPAAVHMVHSWSAVAPGRPNTVAGRWLQRGTFAYIGSVHEPYLQAFVPTPLFAERMLAGMAWGAAGRLDEGPVWRVAVLGDPLFGLRPAPARREGPTPLENAEPLAADLRPAADEQRYADLFSTLVRSGRDSDVARLFEAMLRDEPQRLDPAVADAALLALFRTGSDEAFLRAFSVLDPDRAADTNPADALWHLGRRAVRLRNPYAEAALSLMARHVRDHQREEDAATLRQLGGSR